MAEIVLSINGKKVVVEEGTTVAGAILREGIRGFRTSVGGEPRGPLCGMGICFECRVMIDGVGPQRSCQTLCAAGMEVRTDG